VTGFLIRQYIFIAKILDYRTKAHEAEQH